MTPNARVTAKTGEPHLPLNAALPIANGWALDRREDDLTPADASVTLIEHRVSEADFAERLRPHVRLLG